MGESSPMRNKCQLSGDGGLSLNDFGRFSLEEEDDEIVI